MYQTITQSDFIEAFSKMGRKDNFSYSGLVALYDYLESYEEDTGEKLELDVIALCCEYTEYSDFAELQGDYNNIEDMDELKDETVVIEILDSDGFIIQDY